MPSWIARLVHLDGDGHTFRTSMALGAGPRLFGGLIAAQALAAAAATVVEHAPRFGAVALGPGLGRADGTAAAVREIVATVRAPLVVDADALRSAFPAFGDVRGGAILGGASTVEAEPATRAFAEAAREAGIQF